jgi:hypothetical protein
MFVFENPFGSFSWKDCGGSTSNQTWFCSKFSSSSCITLTQLGLDKACPIIQGLKEAMDVE